MSLFNPALVAVFHNSTFALTWGRGVCEQFGSIGDLVVAYQRELILICISRCFLQFMTE